jgi:hypothetical protein
MTYGDSGHRIEIEDRALAHLQIVIGTKLRRKEPFFFSWTVGTNSGGGRAAIWLDPSIHLSFHFAGHKPVAVNRQWLEALATAANSTSGLHLVEEPITEPAVAAVPQPVREPERVH